MKISLQQLSTMTRSKGSQLLLGYRCVTVNTGCAYGCTNPVGAGYTDTTRLLSKLVGNSLGVIAKGGLQQRHRRDMEM